MQKALVPIADGSEEMEVVIIIDCLRRAGIEVTSVSIGAATISASRHVRLLADALWDDIDPHGFDVLILPGGNDGTDALMHHEGVLQSVRQFVDDGKMVAAICAAPQVLQAAGVITGKRVTSHPAVREKITEAVTTNARVETDGNIITSQGPGTTMEFALALIARIAGQDKAQEVAAGLILPTGTTCASAPAD
jgi:4-methyl-5(b-hydroxyethyl)-thiazole monophosphate biosynthesis